MGWFNVDTETIDNYSLRRQSFGAGIAFNYSLSENALLRLRTGITKSQIKETSDFSGGMSASGTQSRYHFAPGIIWKISHEKFDIVGGFELPVNLHGKYVLTIDNRNLDTNTGEAVLITRQKYTIQNGYSIGAGALFGFAYSLTPTLSVGAEFATSLLYGNLGGKTTYEEIQFFSNTSYSNTAEVDSDKGLTFVERRFSLNFTVKI